MRGVRPVTNVCKIQVNEIEQLRLCSLAPNLKFVLLSNRNEGVRSLLGHRSAAAPPSSSTITTSSWPADAASCNGVWPSSSIVLACPVQKHWCVMSTHWQCCALIGAGEEQPSSWLDMIVCGKVAGVLSFTGWPWHRGPATRLQCSDAQICRHQEVEHARGARKGVISKVYWDPPAIKREKDTKYTRLRGQTL